MLRRRPAPSNRTSGERGQSLVELALVVPVLLLLLGGAIDLGRVFYSQIAITDAAREGALWAVQHPGSWNQGCDTQAITPTNPDQVTCHAVGESTGGFATVSAADVTCSSTDPAAPGGTVTPCSGAAPAPGASVWVTVRGTFKLAMGGTTLPMSATAVGRIALAPGNAPPSDQTISFTSNPPSPAYVSYTYVPTATSSSLLPVTLTIDTTTSSVCSLSGGVVRLLAVGTCTIHANQAGDSTHNPAPQVSQSFTVLSLPADAQTIDFPALADRTLDSGSFTVVATSSSTLPVTLTSTTPATCTVSGFVVTLHAKGVCSITATQPGGVLDAITYQPAPDITRTFTVASSCVKPTGGIDGSPKTGKAATSNKAGTVFTFTWTGPAVPAKCDGIDTVWSWAFGDGAGTTSTPGVATHTYPIGTSNGDKVVTLTISVGDDVNLSSTFTTTVKVN